VSNLWRGVGSFASSGAEDEDEDGEREGKGGEEGAREGYAPPSSRIPHSFPRPPPSSEGHGQQRGAEREALEDPLPS